MNVLIMGGSNEIGLLLANRLKKISHVILTYHTHIPVIDGVTLLKCNVMNEREIAEVIEKGNQLLGNDYVLINLFSVSMDEQFLSKKKDSFMHVLEVNLWGMFLCNQIYSKSNLHGMIINMSSTDGIDTYNEYNVDYAVSKAGIITMSKMIGDFSLNKVICLCPNWIDTKSTRMMNQEYLQKELKRIGQSRLIQVDEIVDRIFKIVVDGYQNRDNFKQTDVIRIDIKDGKVWIVKVS